LFTPLPTITVELSHLRSSSPSPPCLGYHRPQPLVLLRPHLLHPEHRRALGYLTGLFFLTDEHHSDPSPEFFFPPRLLPPRAHPGELPSVQRPKLGSSSSRACSTVINSMAPTAGRSNFAGEPPSSGGGGGFPPLFSPCGLKQPRGLGHVGPELRFGVGRLGRPPQGWSSSRSAVGHIRPKRPDLFKI
jgi:hypothetical protein